MFPVTRQVRRKRTPVSAGQVASAGALTRAGRAEESGGACAESGGACAQRVGSGEKQRGLGQKAGAGLSQKQGGPGEGSVGSGRT
jgi:hypothetical protein